MRRQARVVCDAVRARASLSTLITSRDADVFNRALALCAHYLRARIEGGLKYSDGDSRRHWRAFEGRMRDWGNRANVVDLMSPKERKLWRSKVGAWTARSIIDGCWRLEAIGVLAWAVRLTRTMPPWDKEIAHEVILKFGAPRFNARVSKTKSPRSKSRLRTSEELLRALDVAELWHWRAVTASRPRSAKLLAIISDAAKYAHEKGDIARPKRKDFPLFGKSYAQLTRDERETAMSISIERHHAMEWLTGEDAWDEVRTDT